MTIFNYKVSPFDFYRIRIVLVLSIVASLTTYIYNLVTGFIEASPSYVLIIGFTLGVFVGILEEFILVRMFRKIRLFYMILIRSLIYICFVTILLLGLDIFVSLINGKEISHFFNILSTEKFLYNFIFIIITIDFLVFFNQTSKLFGHTNLMILWGGKYRYPVKEERIFMFVDLISSTEISNKLERIQYFNLIDDFFHDLTIPVLRTAGHIYQYVGDEAVITWKMDEGLKNNNCIHLFHLIQKEVQKNSTRYLKKYGLVPRFKAGVHCGEVITAEVGDLKTEIIHNGEVVNVSARIRSTCSKYKRDFLISEKLKSLLSFSDNFITENIGKVHLNGVPEPMELYAVEPKEEDKAVKKISRKKNSNYP